MRLGTVRLATCAARLGAVPFVESSVPVVPPPTGGGYPITQPPSRGTGQALLHRDYRVPAPPRRIIPVHGQAFPDAVVAGVPMVGRVRARGAIGYIPGHASARGVSAGVASVGRAEARGAARVVVKAPKAMTSDEWFLLGFVAGQADGD